MMKCKVHPDIINFIANIYTDDETNPLVNGESAGNVKITISIHKGLKTQYAEQWPSFLQMMNF